MDIHKPKAAHSVREFLIEIGTITVGILIALGLESAAEAYRHHELVERARADLRAELRGNRERLAGTVAQEKAAAAPLDTLGEYVLARLRGGRAQSPPTVHLTLALPQMSTAAWESTVATQALAHMPYDEARALTRAYQGSRTYNEFQGEAVRHWIELNAVISDPGTLSPDGLREARRELVLNGGYQETLVSTGERLLQAYDQALAALR